MANYFSNCILLSLISISISCSGCSNSNSDQEVEDKETEYKKVAPVTFTNVELIAGDLPSSVEEQSGLIYYNNLFWIINDSGADPEIIAYDKDGIIKQTVTVENAQNIDWEDLTDDENYFYIGDFGNNNGNRKDLKVLKVSKNDIPEVGNGSVNAEKITFNWSDQTDFSKRSHNNNYDCEAIFSFGDKLYLFTKNWVNYKTTMYALPKIAGDYSLAPIKEFDIDYMITGVDISSDGKSVAFIGYKNYQTYFTLITNIENNEFFSGNVNYYHLTTLGTAQTEAIVFDDNNSIFISCERNKTSTPKQSLFRINL